MHFDCVQLVAHELPETGPLRGAVRYIAAALWAIDLSPQLCVITACGAALVKLPLIPPAALL